MKISINTILFDLDNTLADMKTIHYESFRKAINELCHFNIDEDWHDSEMNGLSTNQKLKYLEQEGYIAESEFKDIWDLKQKYTVELIEKNLQTDWSKIRLHQRIHELGINIGCVTNSIRKTAELILAKTGQLEYMKVLITNEDVSKPKPDPEGYILAMNKLEANPESTLIIEDNANGLAAAKASGAKVLQVKDPKDVNLHNIISNGFGVEYNKNFEKLKESLI